MKKELNKYIEPFHIITKFWPIKKLDNPRRRHTWETFTLPSITFELPIQISPKGDPGQVYRSRAIKYPGAQDTYVAFAWRYFPVGTILPDKQNQDSE